MSKKQIIVNIALFVVDLNAIEQKCTKEKSQSRKMTDFGLKNDS